MKMKGKENQIIEVLNQVMGKGGICIHYILPVISVGVMAGRDFDRLVYRLFSFFITFSVSSFCVWGRLLGERIRTSTCTPFRFSWDTILSLNPTSAYRGTDKRPKNQ